MIYVLLQVRGDFIILSASSASDASHTMEANLPNLETVVRNAGGVSLEVEEPRDDVEDAQPGGDGRVLQAAQQQHDEEHGHHLQRVLVPPLHSKQHKNQQGFRCHPSSPSLPINHPLTSHEQLITRGEDGRILGAPARS